VPRAVSRPQRLAPFPRQDPQDEAASTAALRSRRELRTHAALQHVPYRRGSFSVELIGARNGRAVLAVRAPRIALARRGWRRFLRRFGDNGRAYLASFEATGRREQRGAMR
jgi:hypothetical protein